LKEVWLPKTLKRLGKNVFLHNLLSLLALHSTLEVICSNDLYAIHHTDKPDELSDGSEKKEILIQYDKESKESYLDFYDVYKGRTRVYKRLDPITGDRYYLNCGNDRTYKNTKKYDAYSEWRTTCTEYENDLELKKQISKNCMKNIVLELCERVYMGVF